MIVDESIRIQASSPEVWAAITDVKRASAWFAGATVEGEFSLGSALTFSIVLNGKKYVDRGTVLAFEPERVLRYSHWSATSRLPDVPEKRTIATVELKSEGDATLVHARHENFHHDSAFKHARFFWRNALYDLKKLVEAA